MAPGRVITLLHLSDLHFGRYHRFAADEGLGSLLDRLRDDLDKRRDRDGLRPDLLIVSGDLAEYGRKEEIERGFRFIEALARLLELPRRRVAVVPGNHDINWNKSRAYFEDCEGDGVPPVEPYFRKLVFYQQLFERFYEGEPGISFTEDEPWTLFEHPDLGVVVAGLNSVIAESHRAEDHHGFLGERQLRAFAEKLRPYKERGFLRVGVMHHDPFQRPNARVEQDFKDLSRLLRPSLNLMLHGDVHEERLQWLWRDVPVFGIGSAAVGVAQRAPEVPNEYQLLQIHAGGVRWGLRAYVSDEGWGAGGSGADGGERWILEEPVAFEQVHALAQVGGLPPATDKERGVESYRKAIARNQGMPTVFDLLGVNEAGESAGGLDFLRVFVPQDAKRVMAPARPRRAMREEELTLSPLEPATEADEDPLVTDERLFFHFDRVAPVDELLGGGLAPRLFLLGAPGAGKTALTRWLLLKLCIPGEGVFGLSDALIPVRVEMRRFDEEHRRATGEHTFFDHLDREHGERFLSLRGEALRALALEGRLFWIFDGVDEVVDEERRRRYAEMIAGLSDEYWDCHILVTSRPIGSEVALPLLERAGFVTYALQDFTEPQRDRFLDAWHELVFARDPAVGLHRRDRMARALGRTASLADLCRSPLLCALLAYLNRAEELPERRHRLYQKILERMAEHWDANKGLQPRPESERFDLDSKLLFLRRLAWQMREDPGRGAGNAIEQGDLEGFAARFCEERWGQAPDAAHRTAEALLRQLRERNYVLTFLGGTTYGFAHRTFLDYLAALEAHERFRGRQWELEDLGKLFAARWRDRAWEETLLLICGFLAEVDPDHVVRVLQGVPGSDLALVYGALDEYLAFCVTALGEVSRLNRGAPYELACAIGDTLRILIHDDVLNRVRLREAFRHCSGRWPWSEIEGLVQATQHAVSVRGRALHDLHDCWIAAAGRERRLSVLSAVLAEPWLPARTVCEEASLLGPWPADEIESLCRLVEERAPEQRFDILGPVVLTPGMTWNEDDPPIRLLLDFVHRSPYGAPRVWAGSALLTAGCCQEQVLHTLVELASSSDGYASMSASHELGRAGFTEYILRGIDRADWTSPYKIAALIGLSGGSSVARAALYEIIRKAEASAPQVFVEAYIAAAQRGLMITPVNELLERLRVIDDMQLKMSLLREVGRFPALCPMVADEYAEMYRSATEYEHRAWIAREAMCIDPQLGGAGTIQLWSSLLSAEEPDIAISVAGGIVRAPVEPSLHRRARDLLVAFLGDAIPEDLRWMAARSLGVQDSFGRAAHGVLARTVADERVRFNAARYVGDLDMLGMLAEGARHPHWRQQARHALDVYAHISFLLHVGRPRRARVLLHGRRVGRLEETSAGGGTRFTYAADHLAAPDARPLPPNLPLRPEPYESDTLHPFFANLLPEGPLFDQTARRLGLRRTDRFGMLLKVGADVMGAVEVLPEEDA